MSKDLLSMLEGCHYTKIMINKAISDDYKEVTFNCSKTNEKATSISICEYACPRYSYCNQVANVQDVEKVLNHEEE